MKKSTKSICIIIIMALVLGVFVPVVGMEAQAAKKVTANLNRKKALSVKVGTTTITTKVKLKSKGDTVNPIGSYVKFKAPKKGTYQFTMSNLRYKSNSGEDALGSLYFENSKGVTIRFKTQSGKSDSLSFTPFDYIDEEEEGEEGEITTGTVPEPRTATIKLKKGQTIYLYFESIEAATYTYNLKIKKK